MRLHITNHDPKTFTKPFSVAMDVIYQADSDLIETVCLENEKDHARMIGKVQDETKGAKKVAPAILAQYAGVYDTVILGLWTVSASGDQLSVELPDGGGRQPLLPQTDSSFVFPTIGGTIAFGRDDAKGAVTHFILTVVEGDFKAMRK
jgi:hypothetical protein